MEGRRVLIVRPMEFVSDDAVSEETYIVKKFKNYLPPDEEAGRDAALVQFWDAEFGGLRTVKARHIARIR